ncbi:hypothetical protein ACL7TT_20100 [Microbulbifer sp. 2304DJ12-6]
MIETAASNEEQLAEYCRCKGLYAEQVHHSQVVMALAASYPINAYGRNA